MPAACQGLAGWVKVTSSLIFTSSLQGGIRIIISRKKKLGELQTLTQSPTAESHSWCPGAGTEFMCPAQALCVHHSVSYT